MILRDKRENPIIGPGHKEHALDLPFWRDNNKLHALDINAEVMDMGELRWMLEIPFWEDKNGNIVVTVNQVLTEPERYPEHTKLIDDCDTSYPVHITKNKLNEWIIVDGLHRMAKLIREGKQDLMVKKVTTEQLYLCKDAK